MSTLFTRYARLTLLAVFLIVAAGLGALGALGRQEDPTLIERFGVVVTNYPGASAERVEALVTQPLEETIMELAEVNQIGSTSRANISIVTVELRQDLSAAQVDQAWSLVRDQAERARQSFPAGAGAPDVDRQYIGAATMIVELSWEDGADRALGILTRLARDLEDRFQSLDGTEETDVFGEAEEEVRVVLDSDRIAALGLTTADVAALLAASDARAPAGQVRAPGMTLGVEFAGELDSVGRIRAVPLMQSESGQTVRVGDVARVEKTERSPPSTIALADGRRAVFVAAYLQPSLRVDRWTERAREVVDRFDDGLPSGINVNIAFEQNEYVERRLHGLFGNLMAAAVLVFLVLYLMMGFRSALIVGTALPLTTLLCLILIRLSGEPLHQMSVTGLVIALGMLIDNAIVVVDEYRLRRRKGAARLEAVDQSVRHLFAPLAASTVTTMLAFAPIALAPNTTGEFIRYIGISVIFAVGSSFFLAMTVIPAFAAWFDREPAPGERRRWERDGITFPALGRAFEALIRLVARAPIIGVVIATGLPALGFYLASTLPLQFFPPTDRDMFQVELVLPPETSIEETRRAVARASDLIRSYDGVESVSWMIGAAAPRTYYNVLGVQYENPGFAAAWVRTRSASATRRVALALQREAPREFPSARFLALPFEQGPPVAAPIEARLFGADVRTLAALGAELRVTMSQSDSVTFTTSSMRLGAPVARIDADESAAEMTGRRLSDLAETLRTDLDGAIGGAVLEGVESLPIRVIVDDDARNSLDAVRGRPLPSLQGSDTITPIGALGPVTLEPEIATITRRNGERVNWVYAFLDPFSFPDTTMRDFEERFADSGFSLPPGYRLEFGGEQEERGETVSELLGTAVPLFILMIGALVLAFNNFTYAGVVVLVGIQSVGLALFGVWMFGQPAGFMAIIGAMGLVGLAINGSIVVLSALRSDPLAATGDPAAVAATTLQATRHILATTLTTIGGFTPLLILGESFWLPLAAAISGGVAGSAVLALVFAPAAFAFMTRRRTRKMQRRADRAARRAAARAPAE